MAADESSESTKLDSPTPPDLSNTEKAAEQLQPDAPPRDITGWKWAVATAAILSSIFLYALDGTVVAVIQATIIHDFDALDDLSWNVVGFLMGATATNMVWGQVYGQFDNKWVYIFNVAVFEAGSALCGAAPNMNALIVGRVICGVAGAGLYVGVFAIIAATTTMAERPIYVSGTGLTWGLGTVLGPVVGGAFEQSAVGWRWAFYINLFIGAVCAPAYLFLLPSKDPRPGVPVKSRLKELDYAGMVLLVGCLVSVIVAINFGGVKYPWASGQIIGLFATAVALFALLCVQQGWAVFTTLPRRLVPVQFMQSPSVIMLFVCTSASAAGVFVPIFFVPLFFQFTRGDDALDAGVRLLPIIVLLIVSITVNGVVMAKFGYYMPWYLVGGLMTVVGGALMYTVDQDTSPGRVYGYTVLIGVGVGMFIQASFSVAQAKVAPENVNSVIGFITLAQFLGNAVALAIANAIFLNEAEASVARLLPGYTEAEIEAAVGGVSGDLVQDLDPDVRNKVVGAIVDAMSKTYILCMTAGALVAVLSVFMKREKLFITAAAGGM
ncbi:hypothetical protein N3K66_002816 [Trichothecium roseum]|uniref:Uncharacterized protein n=1 Tax=Trichothecium roseum TaxID=47278 RepID=A0ACC0VB89_9HYPO|nr:hypothetical protein N3K66_002816 [Trichothecium roseum]